MLTNLHVKNLALIEEADINFFDGLNIMTVRQVRASLLYLALLILHSAAKLQLTL